MNETDLEFVKKAVEFAARAHAGQTYGTLPYVHHLDMVYNVLCRFGLKDRRELLAAAYLHDVIEDTPANYNDVFRAFGKQVAELVYAVTDELGRNRDERHVKTWPKLEQMPEAMELKLADRVANVEHSIRAGVQDKFYMYRDEHQEFRQALFKVGGEFGVRNRLWLRLDELMGLRPFVAPENCGTFDQDLVCLGCGRRKTSVAYCNLSVADYEQP